MLLEKGHRELPSNRSSSKRDFRSFYFKSNSGKRRVMGPGEQMCAQPSSW